MATCEKSSSTMFLALFIVSVAFFGLTWGQEFLIESPKVTNWGDWGARELCPNNSYVYGMRTKIQPYGSLFVDDTALNGIELLCISPTFRMGATTAKLFATITSSVGHMGTFTPVLECPEPEYAVGFQLRSEENRLIEDDTTANDLKLMCSGGDSIGGYNITNFGEWTTAQRCPRGLLICGIETQVEPSDQTDETSLNNVNMICCSQT